MSPFFSMFHMTMVTDSKIPMIKGFEKKCAETSKRKQVIDYEKLALLQALSKKSSKFT